MGTDYIGSIALTGSYALVDFSAVGDKLTATVRVYGASASSRTALLAALTAQMQGAGCAWVHYAGGVASPVVYRLSDVSASVLEDALFVTRHRAEVKITATVDPFPVGTLSSRYVAEALNTPGALSLATVAGTRPPQLDLTIDDAAGTDMHSVWACLALREMTSDQALPFTGASARSHWLVLAASLTWATMSSGTGATWWGNSNRSTTSALWQSAALNTACYKPGKYKLLARVQQSAGTGYIMDSSGMTAVPVTRATPHLVELGDIDLPVSDSAPGISSNLTLYARSDGVNTLTVNGYLVLPLEHGLVAYHPDVATTEIDQLDIGPSGIFCDSRTDFTDIVGGILQPKILAAHTPTLVAVEEPSGNVWPASWGRTNGTDVTALNSKFHIVAPGAQRLAWTGVAVVDRATVIPGEVYEITATRQVTAYTAGSAALWVEWHTLDGAIIAYGVNAGGSAVAVDASPVDLTLYTNRAPAQVGRLRVFVGSANASTLTVDWWNIAVRRCPLQLLVAVEDAAGALTAFTHPVLVTLKYTPVYDGER